MADPRGIMVSDVDAKEHQRATCWPLVNVEVCTIRAPWLFGPSSFVASLIADKMIAPGVFLSFSVSPMATFEFFITPPGK